MLNFAHCLRGEIASFANHARASWMLRKTLIGRCLSPSILNLSANGAVLELATIAIAPRCRLAPTARTRPLKVLM